jgi:hypothetical protein
MEAVALSHSCIMGDAATNCLERGQRSVRLALVDLDQYRDVLKSAIYPSPLPET